MPNAEYSPLVYDQTTGLSNCLIFYCISLESVASLLESPSIQTVFLVIFRAQSLNLSSGVLVLPDVNF